MTFWGVLATAIVMFTSTNIDDALLLVVYFASAAEGEEGVQKHHVWIGQTVGFTLIVLVSLVGISVGSLLPPHYAGLLGFLPLGMGLWRMRAWCAKDASQTAHEDTEYHLHSTTPADEERRSCSTDGSAQGDQERRLEIKSHSIDIVEDGGEHPPCSVQEDPATSSPSGAGAKLLWCLSSVLSIHTMRITAVTVANGGDNVATYIPVLVTYNAGEILITVAVFYVMLAVWLYIASALVSFRFVAAMIDKYGAYLIPIAMVLLGLYILWSADVVALL